MALPTILIDSATGSDTAASGAGPATALTGTAASTNAGGTVVTLDGSPDLSGVSTTGSDVIFLNDSTAGNRNFGKITAADNSAKTVTVADAFGGSLSGKSWAIGGKRASIGSTTSVKLVNNNGASGDAMPGWTIQPASGHTETISSALQFYRAGSEAAGPITFGAVNGVATRPVFTYSGSAQGFIPRANYWIFQNIELVASGAGTTAIDLTASEVSFINIRIATAGGSWTAGLDNGDLGGAVINSEITGITGYGIGPGGAAHFTIRGCWIHDNTSHGISVISTESLGGDICDNLIDSNGGDGINWGQGASANRSANISGNTFYNNTGSGLKLTAAVSDCIGGIRIFDNIFDSNGAYGVNFSDASCTAVALQAHGLQIRNNCFHSNTSGATNPSGISIDGSTADPQFTDGPNANFSIGTNLKALGFPVGTIGLSPTSNYKDIGAAQRQEPSGGGGSAGILVNPGLAGGMNG